MTELGQDSHEGARQQQTRSRRRLTALTTTAAVAVLAAGGVFSVTALSGHHGMPLARPAAPPPGGPDQISTATLLAKIASAAARQPEQKVSNSQWEYIASEVRYEQVGQPEWGRQSTLIKREIWISVSDLCKPPLVKTQPSSGPQGIAVEPGPCPDPGNITDPTYRFLQTLPTSPHVLLKMIYKQTKGQGLSPDWEAFDTVGALLQESIAPPAVSAALYRATALIPGVRVVPCVNILGHTGVGVQFAGQARQGVPYREVADPNGPTWIFNPTTLQWVGAIEPPIAGVSYSSVVLQRAVVGRPGQLPATGGSGADSRLR